MDLLIVAFICVLIYLPYAQSRSVSKVPVKRESEPHKRKDRPSMKYLEDE